MVLHALGDRLDTEHDPSSRSQECSALKVARSTPRHSAGSTLVSEHPFDTLLTWHRTFLTILSRRLSASVGRRSSCDLLPSKRGSRLTGHLRPAWWSGPGPRMRICTSTSYASSLHLVLLRHSRLVPQCPSVAGNLVGRGASWSDGRASPYISGSAASIPTACFTDMAPSADRELTW